MTGDLAAAEGSGVYGFPDLGTAGTDLRTQEDDETVQRSRQREPYRVLRWHGHRRYVQRRDLVQGRQRQAEGGTGSRRDVCALVITAQT